MTNTNNHNGQDLEARRREHEKFSRLLESMKGDLRQKADTRAVSELETIIGNFEIFIQKKSISLHEDELNRISAITGSAMSPHVKKRMMEDIIHSVKSRYQQRESDHRAREQAEAEINRMNNNKGSLQGWLQLTRFALQYGTLTLFSHRLREKSFRLLRGKAAASVEIITEAIEETLTSEYYTLTNLEYNALELITQLKSPLHDIAAIPQQTSYSTFAIDAVMDSLARVYTVILANADIITRSMKKAFETKKAPHGFFGVLFDLIDRPIFENRPLDRTRGEKVKSSFPGVLFSYYSARMGCTVTTLNQIIYIIQGDPVIDSGKKHLTQGALAMEEQRRQQKDDEGIRILETFQDLDLVVNTLLPKGPALEEKIYQAATGSKYQTWINEHMVKPALRIRRLLEGFITHFTDVISDEDGFILLYDGEQYRGFFSDQTALMELLSSYNLYEFDLAASRAADLARLTVPEPMTPEDYLHYLTRPEAPRSEYSPIETDVRQLLLAISRKSYSLGGELNRIINEFYRKKELIHDSVESGFDFFTSAVVEKNRTAKAYRILTAPSITLQDFLESACAISFHIARLLNHPGIEAMEKELELLKPKADAARTRMKEATSSPHSIPDIRNLTHYGEGIDDAALYLYRDTLTGLWKQEFLEDYIIPDTYDTDNRYYSDTMRFVFVAEIDSISEINTTYGHDTGDRIFSEVSRRFLNFVCHQTGEKHNIVLRHEGTCIIGYINNSSHASALDILDRVHTSVSQITLDVGKKIISSVPLSIGIYQEHRGTEVHENLSTAKNIMYFVRASNGNNIGFVKNQHRIITERDYSRRGEIDPSLLTLLHSIR